MLKYHHCVSLIHHGGSSIHTDDQFGCYYYLRCHQQGVTRAVLQGRQFACSLRKTCCLITDSGKSQNEHKIYRQVTNFINMLHIKYMSLNWFNENKAFINQCYHHYRHISIQLNTGSVPFHRPIKKSWNIFYN